MHFSKGGSLAPTFRSFALLFVLLNGQNATISAQNYARIIDHFGTTSTDCSSDFGHGDALLCGTSISCSKSVLRLDSASNVIWYKSIETDTLCLRPRDCGRFPNGDAYVLSAKAATPYIMSFEVMRIDTAGQVLWANRYDLTDPSLSASGSYKAKCAPNGDLVIQFGIADQRTVLARIDGSGSLVWANVYSENDFEPSFFIWYALHVDDQAIISVHGPTQLEGLSMNEFRVTCLDPDGAVQWTRAYQCPAAPQVLDATRTMDGSWVVAGRIPGVGSFHPFMAKIDTSGDVQWAAEYPSDVDQNIRIDQLPEDELLLSYVPSSSVGHSFIRATAAGQPISRFHFYTPFVYPTFPEIIEASAQRIRLAGAMNYTVPDWINHTGLFDLAFGLDAPVECPLEQDTIGYMTLTLGSTTTTTAAEPTLITSTAPFTTVTEMDAALLGDLCEYATAMDDAKRTTEELRISPVPNDGTWWMELPERPGTHDGAVLSVRNAVGQIMLSTRLTASGRVQVDMRGSPSGLYLVEVLEGTIRYQGHTVLE